MAIEQYYLTNMQKCSFLFDKVMNGNTDESNLRRIVVNNLRKKETEFLKKLTKRKDIHEWAIKESLK